MPKVLSDPIELARLRRGSYTITVLHSSFGLDPPREQVVSRLMIAAARLAIKVADHLVAGELATH
jgi:hypothetical protein